MIMGFVRVKQHKGSLLTGAMLVPGLSYGFSLSFTHAAPNQYINHQEKFTNDTGTIVAGDTLAAPSAASEDVTQRGIAMSRY